MESEDGEPQTRLNPVAVATGKDADEKDTVAEQQEVTAEEEKEGEEVEVDLSSQPQPQQPFSEVEESPSPAPHVDKAPDDIRQLTIRNLDTNEEYVIGTQKIFIFFSQIEAKYFPRRERP